LSLLPSPSSLKSFLDQAADRYNRPEFIETDPIRIPRMFAGKEDIEIAGFLTATISWGNRASILNSANRMMGLMDHAPFDFIMHHRPADLKRLKSYVHRTFNGEDLEAFVVLLKCLYRDGKGLEGHFVAHQQAGTLQPAIHRMKSEFMAYGIPDRTKKHLPDPLAGSAAKRINMFLRWMVRKDNRGVDFGLWKSVSPSILSCPLDVHSGNVARKLGLLQRKQNDSRAVQELDNMLRKFDPADPVKYDFALFGLGVFEKFRAVSQNRDS
jgi:uncharacterized protein (TIGR02757 family)